MSYVVFPTSNVIFAVLWKGCRFWFCGNYINDVCCLLIAYGIYVGAYCIRPVRHRPSRTANRRHDIVNRRNSGRMQYAPTAAQFAV